MDHLKIYFLPTRVAFHVYRRVVIGISPLGGFSNITEQLTPPKTNMTMENPPFEDLKVHFLLKHEDFPMSW